jgi:hypothetical protein
MTKLRNYWEKHLKPKILRGIRSAYLKNGDYNQAVAAFGDTKSNNAALAQLLIKDYSRASETLVNIANPDATTAYLQAVIAAPLTNTLRYCRICKLPLFVINPWLNVLLTIWNLPNIIRTAILLH